MKKLVIGSSAFVAISLSAAVASASYACDPVMWPGPSEFGNYGYAAFNSFTGPDCSGTWEGTFFLCSTGATSHSCADNVLSRFTTAEQLATVAAELFESSMWNAPIGRSAAWCIGGAYGCLGAVSFL
jgi:hypothetical protein